MAPPERDGEQPGPADLDQALLRLPRDPGPAVQARAAALSSPAGRRLHHWLATGGLPDPETAPVLVEWGACPHDVRGYHCWCQDLPAHRMVVEVRPTATRLSAAAAGLLDLPAHSARQRAYGEHRPPGDLGMWPVVLPSHRELIAAHLQPFLAPAADRDRSGGTAVLPALARCTGPFGPATALCLAYGLAARKDGDRLFAVDALVLLAGSDGFDGELVGRLLAELVVLGEIVLRRAVTALQESARAGVEAAVWAVAAGALPVLLRMSGASPGLPDLLALAARCAPAGPRQVLPEVAETAACSGRLEPPVPDQRCRTAKVATACTSERPSCSTSASHTLRCSPCLRTSAWTTRSPVLPGRR